MKLPNLTHIIQSVVIFIAAGSFLISYNNLHESAIEMGIPALLAIVFPLTIDLFLLAATLAILYAGQKCGNRAISLVREGWLFLVLYTFASIAFNIHMAPDDWWSRAGFAMCPIGLCIALHFLMRILEIEMGGCNPEIVEVKPTESCSAQIEEIKPIESEQPIEEEIKQEQKLTEQQKKVLDCFKSESDISMAEAGRRLDMSYKTVKKYKDQLIEMGML